MNRKSFLLYVVVVLCALAAVLAIVFSGPTVLDGKPLACFMHGGAASSSQCK